MSNKSTKDRIKNIQRFLNLDADGVIGSDTLTAIENRLFENVSDTDDGFSLTISRQGLEQLIQHEISSKSYYNRSLKRPIWPGGASGVTIGIGYDLGYNKASQIRNDWRGKISDLDLEKLVAVSGLKSDDAKSALRRVKTVEIAFEEAKQVFSETTLPRYAAVTRKAYPGVESLFPDTQAALLSLVYNRGPAMSGTRRKEMSAIRSFVAQQDYAGIEQQLISMKRLWEGKGLAGLLKRRDDEASLVSGANRTYDDSNLIRV